MHQHTSSQGNIGLGKAISYFTAQGYIVSIPLNDAQGYDLLVHKPPKSIKRVEVKTTLHHRKYKQGDTYQAQICRKRKGKVIFFDSNSADLIFIHTGANESFVIPSYELEGRKWVISLGKRWEHFKVSDGI